MPQRQYPLEAARDVLGFSRRAVADALGLDPTGLKKVEWGVCRPKLETAEKIFDFYDGIVPLGMIFHTSHWTYNDWLTSHKQRLLRARARDLEVQYPALRPE